MGYYTEAFDQYGNRRLTWHEDNPLGVPSGGVVSDGGAVRAAGNVAISIPQYQDPSRASALSLQSLINPTIGNVASGTFVAIATPAAALAQPPAQIVTQPPTPERPNIPGSTTPVTRPGQVTLPGVLPEQTGKGIPAVSPSGIISNATERTGGTQPSAVQFPFNTGVILVLVVLVVLWRS